MIRKNNNQYFITISFIMLTFVFFTTFLVNNTPAFGENSNNSKLQDAKLALTDYNFIATGDWYCNDETKKTIKNILATHPELIITTGDQVKESPSAQC